VSSLGNRNLGSEGSRRRASAWDRGAGKSKRAYTVEASILGRGKGQARKLFGSIPNWHSGPSPGGGKSTGRPGKP